MLASIGVLKYKIFIGLFNDQMSNQFDSTFYIIEVN